ncbi:serine protease [Wenyingzhuangia sp. 2_MG-2023]|nr:serine protease [Wenyingzhuangia sp. 2_MG-2023]MDO6737380.1 serine protease [Wenyingzhuangia sp. 2_MG-2023]
MSNIIDPSQIQNSIIKIEYKGNQGTGFFVSQNVILTAFHIFLEAEIDNSKIVILKNNEVIIGKVLSYDDELDICLIKTEESFNSYLPSQSTGIKIKEDWQTFGFPNKGEQDAMKFFGTISHKETKEKYDFILNSEQVESTYDYGGLSGAPVVSNEKVIGIILKQIDDKLGAISIDEIKDYLAVNDIDFEIEENHTDLPSQFTNEIQRSVKNKTVLDSLENATLKKGNWILMTGTPGSGKSLNIALFKPQNDTISIIGKYFVKIPNDDKPKSLRTSRAFFLKWLEELIVFTVHGSTLPKETKSIDERIERLPSLVQDLSVYYSKNKQTGVLCIDGLDEIEGLKEFIGIINFTLPKNIKVILSCTSKEILPREIKNYINTEEQLIKVTPINLTKCEHLIIREIGSGVLKIENVQQLALKSEGHPLYLRYLINFVKNNNELKEGQDNFEEWIEKIPVIEGDIENYYNSIWDLLYEDKNKLWISLSISQLRSPLEKENIIHILPTDVKASFYSSFPSIKYLFTEQHNKIEIFHNSFKEFITKKVEFFIKDCNDNIVTFCENNIDNEYSIENGLHHYTLSNTPENALQNCNQEWADKLALNHIEPDLVLLDIKNTISLSLKLKQTTELIRLLLLLQRIEFRYDYVLYEYAENIALALIANKKYKHALKYIVRRNILLVDNHQAIIFLQLLYEAEAFKEANVLLEAIDARFRKEIGSDQGNEEGIPMDIFIMQANALTLSSFEDFEIGYGNFMKFKSLLKMMQTESEADTENNNTSNLYLIREFCASWNKAYMLRSRDIHVSSIEASEMSGVSIDSKWAKMIALARLHYDEINQYNTNYYDENDNCFKIVNDIEYLISNHGYINDKAEITILIKSLLEDSKNISLVRELINKYFDFEINTSSIRDKNGVDFNFPDFINIEFESKCKGYINEDGIFPKVKDRWGENGWEYYLESLIVLLHFIEGKAYNLKSKDDSEGFKAIKVQLQLIRSSLNFSFEERSHWNRSYQLPEAVFPLLYKELVNLYYNFNNDELDSFLEDIKQNTTDQLGLFSEGYREVLYEIIKQLLLLNYETSKIESLAQLWKQHILNGVQNRWERTEELLKITEIYALLGKTSEFDDTFQEVLNTSMGPTWYKEAQLDLLNSTLSYLKNDSTSINKYIKDYASLLDYASGEMTFQRYVRYEKEGFISSLIINGRLDSALEYFRQEILPSPSLLIDNAEKSAFDAPTIGNGYNLGARNFVEQSGILKILKNIEDLSPYLKWALCKVFTINDDNFRYIISYGEEIAKVLNKIEALDNSYIENITESLSEIIEDQELNKDDTAALLNKLYIDLTSSNIIRLKSHLINRGISWGSENEEEKTIESQPLEKNKKVSEFEKFNNSVNSTTNRLQLVESGINSFEKEKISIWYNNWSGEHSKSKRNIKKLLETDTEITETLCYDILKFNETPWSVCKEVIWFLEGKIAKPQIEDIYKIVNNHFHYIIRPDDAVKEKYSWLDNENEKLSSNSQIIDFLIWLLNHPFTNVREKTFNTLVELATYLGEEIIMKLIESTLSEAPLLSTEISSHILKRVSEINPEIIIKTLETEPGFVSQIAKLSHFTIKYNYIVLANNIQKIGYKKLENEINKTILDSPIKTGDIFLEEDFLRPIDDTLEELNNEELLNGKFCEILTSKVKEYCYPLKPIDLIKSDKYLRRSFYDETQYRGRYDDILNHALNTAITSVVNKNNLKTIFEILNND